MPTQFAQNNQMTTLVVTCLSNIISKWSRWLVDKSSSRLRRDGYTASQFKILIRFHPKGGWKGSLKTFPTQDTLVFLKLNKYFWRQMYNKCQPYRIANISVHLGNVEKLQHRAGEMLLPFESGEANQHEKLSGVMDNINKRFGAGTVKYGLNKPHLGFFDKG